MRGGIKEEPGLYEDLASRQKQKENDVVAVGGVVGGGGVAGGLVSFENGGKSRRGGRG